MFWNRLKALLNWSNNKNQIKIEVKTKPGSLLPKYQTSGSVGMDLHAYLEHSVLIRPMERRLIDTGIAMAIPDGYEGNIRPRSSMCSRWGLMAFEGTIDSDFRGFIKINIINLGNESVMINPGDRIAQVVITPIVVADLVEVQHLSETARGEGGFGSTGK